MNAAIWPTPLGGEGNRAVAPVRMRAGARELWSVPLGAPATGILVTREGLCIASAGELLVAVEPGGRRTWRVTAGAPVVASRILPDGRLLCDEGDALVFRDPVNGARVAPRAPAIVLSAPAVTRDGELAHVERAPSGCPALVLRDRDGNERWSRRLEQRSYAAPLLCGDEIIVGDGSYLKAFDRAGRERWWASREGFRAPSGQAHDPGSDSVRGPLVSVAPGVILAGMSWWGERGYLVFDLARHSVRALVAPGWPIPLGEPLAAVGHATIVTRGALAQDASGTWRSRIVKLDLAGNILWEHWILVRPVALVADAEGRVIVAASPEKARWDGYRHLVDTGRDCFVRGLDARGELLFEWRAPAPISPHLAPGAQGEILLEAAERLRAIG